GVGSDELALRRLDGGGQEIRLNVGDVGRILHAIPSPDGSKIAISSFDNVVRLVTLRGLTDPASTSADTTGAGTADGGAPTVGPAAVSATPWEQDARPAPRPRTWTGCARSAVPTAARSGTWPGRRMGDGW